MNIFEIIFGILLSIFFIKFIIAIFTSKVNISDEDIDKVSKGGPH
jgi:hypothetical protein